MDFNPNETQDPARKWHGKSDKFSKSDVTIEVDTLEGIIHSPNRHAARFSEPFWGHLCFGAIGFLVGSLTASSMGVSLPSSYGLAFGVVVVVFRIFIRQGLGTRQNSNCFSAIQREEEAIAEVLKAEIAAAKASGAFDRFNQAPQVNEKE